MQLRKVALSFVMGVVTLVLVVAPVSAIAREDGQQEPDAGTVRTLEAKEAKRGERLDAAKKRICIQREKTINALMDRRAAQAEKHLQVFNKIFDRTKAFYEKQGNTVADYDALVAAAEAAKADAAAAIAELKALPDFSCNDEAPKDRAIAFKTDRGEMWEKFKAYRTALTNLIKAVKSANAGGER